MIQRLYSLSLTVFGTASLPCMDPVSSTAEASERDSVLPQHLPTRLAVVR